MFRVMMMMMMMMDDVDIQLASHVRSPDFSWNLLHPYLAWDASISSSGMV